VENAAHQLKLLDPRQVLSRGYSLVQDEKGHLVSDATQLASGQALRITFAKGWAQTEVKARGGQVE